MKTEYILTWSFLLYTLVFFILLFVFPQLQYNKSFLIGSDLFYEIIIIGYVLWMIDNWDEIKRRCNIREKEMTEDNKENFKVY